MDPLNTGKINIKALIELLNKDELIACVQGYLINNSMVYYTIFEGLEYKQHEEILKL